MNKKFSNCGVCILGLFVILGLVVSAKGDINIFHELMDPNFFPNAQFGMEIKESSTDNNCLKIETTGSVLNFDYAQKMLQFSQKIGASRNVLKVKLSAEISRPIITHSKSGMIYARFDEAGFDFRANGDSMFMIYAKKPLTISLSPDFVPVFDGNYKSNHLLLDEYGGFGVYCSIIDLPDNYNKLSEVVATYDLPADSVLWIAICPPKEYDWQKSINDNVLWHWSTVTSYPDDETIKSWVPYGNTVLFQGEIMLWKDWNLGFEPRLGIEEWNRVKNTLHQNKMRYMVYTSPYYYLRGTPYESEAVNSFDNFKGWPINKPTHGENVDLFIEAITKVMKELKPDGLYFDGTYRDNIAAQYKLARHTRNIVGENGLLEWHSTLAFGKTKVKDLCYLPQVDAYADYILRGEHLKTDFDDLNYLRYYVSGYNASNSIGVFCTRDHSFITEKFCEILFDNNIRLHLATGKENLRIKKYSGWVYQPQVLQKYSELYLSKLNHGLKDRVEKCCKKRQEKQELVSHQNRPPEMVEAKRDASPYPELINFENLDGWKLETTGGIDADLSITDESIVYGNHSAKIVVNNSSSGKISLLPPKPIAIAFDFDTVNMWTRYVPYKYCVGPNIKFYVVLEDNLAQTYRVDLECGYFGVWEILNTRIIAPDGKRLNYTPSAKMVQPIHFKSIDIEFAPANLPPPFTIYLDSLCIFKEESKPLKYNYSVENLPKPTTSDTILTVIKETVNNKIQKIDNYYELICEDDKDKIIYRILPEKGNLNDVKAECAGNEFWPCHDGGIVFKFGDEIIGPESSQLQVENTSIQLKEDLLDTRWRLRYKDYAAEYCLLYQVKNKSLIVDISTENNNGVEVVLGSAKPLLGAKSIQVPYLRFEDTSPQIISYKDLFLSCFLDWWSSDSTRLYSKNGFTGDGRGIYCNGGSQYLPLTDGNYNNIKERLFITISRDFQEVLPNIPNPKSPYLDKYKCSSWRWLYGGPRKIDWVRQLHDYGVENFMVRFHADGMRDGNESYSLREYSAPSIGDKLFRDVGQELKDMGYGFAVYSSYLGVEGINKNFDLDILNRDTLGNTTAKFLRYRVKPLAFVDIHSEMAARIHKRLGTNFSYLDVHAARAPWRDTDCDSRSPMPGMFRLDFLANAQVMLNDRIAHEGPVWSEGGMQCLYAGFADATYGYMGHETPWDKSTDIVDFDLLRLHPRMISIGMGDLPMYYKKTQFREPRNRFNPWLDRFIAATIAYGHAAWQIHPADYDLGGALKSYFLTNAVQSSYIGVDVEEIGYFDGSKIIDTSKAIQTDAYLLKQIYVHYKNGLQIWANLNHDNVEWKIELDGAEYIIPAGGFVAFKQNELLAYSAKTKNYERHDYVRSPRYIYLDGRDKPIVIEGIKLGKGACAIKTDSKDKFIICALPDFEKLAIDPALIKQIGGIFPEIKQAGTFDNFSIDENGWLNIDKPSSPRTIMSANPTSSIKNN